MNTPPSLLPVTVLTGFLGSGKTTLLNALLPQPALKNAAVLINEFGEIGIDHHLVAEADDDVVILQSGCLCCTVRSDMITALRDLWLRRVRGDVPEFDRVVIETTGLADPAPILHTLITDPLLSARYRLDGIVTTVDTLHILKQLETSPEPIKQVAMADRLVLTKTDLTTPETLTTVKDRLHKLNPAAPQIAALQGAIDPATVLDCGLFSVSGKHPDVARWLNAEAYEEPDSHDHGAHDHTCDEHCGHDHGHDHGHHHHGSSGHDIQRHDAHRHDAHRHDDGISSFCLTFTTPLVWDRVIEAIEILVSTQGDHLLRLKGVLDLQGQETPIAVHGIHHVFHPPAPLPAWGSLPRQSQIVFITRNLDPAAIRSLFAEVTQVLPT